MKEVKEIKTCLLKLDEEIFNEFSQFCKEKGYTKTGWLRAQITNLLKELKQDEQ
jgi:hypothetical protein